MPSSRPDQQASMIEVNDEFDFSVRDESRRSVTVRLLNKMLEIELIGVVRHRRHHFMAKDLTALYTGNEFLDCAHDNQQRADKLAAHISQLGGTPDLSPSGMHLCRHPQPIEQTTLKSLIAEDMIAQWHAKEGYRNLIRYLGDRDLDTRHMLAVILALDQRNKGEFARKILTQCASNGVEP